MVEIEEIKRLIQKNSPSEAVAINIWDSIGAHVEDLYDEIEHLEEQVYELEKQLEEDYGDDRFGLTIYRSDRF